METITLFSILAAGLAIGLGSIGSAIGEGFIAMKAVEALGRQPNASGKLIRVMIVGQAVTEAAAIFALVVSLILVFYTPEAGESIYKGYYLLSAGLAIGLGTIGAGLGGGLPGGSCMEGIGRQPENSDILTIQMIVGQAVTQTSSIFALTVSLILLSIDPSNDIVKVFAVVGGGLAMGLGAIGPGIGDGLVAKNANLAVGKNPRQMGLLTRTMVIGQAITETTDIYSLVVSLILIFVV
ncbi:ATP synthase F0 subunit C [bacterium]|jgi:F-type H+-transporting ATPase subunit c|nr:ATP synthase F0 subunit C [bacterium]